LISVHDISFLPGPHSLSENVRSSRDYYRLQISGECFARSSEKERSPSIVDGLLAATALVHELALVSRNASDFEVVRLAVVNPCEPRTSER